MTSLDPTPKYMIGVAAELLGMHPQTLRLYEARGVIRPRRTPGGTRLYSDADLHRVRRVTELASGLGLSLAGAEYVVGLEDRLHDAMHQIERMQAALAAADQHLHRRIADVHRSYRRELVVWQPPATGVIQHRQRTQPQDVDGRQQPRR